MKKRILLCALLIGIALSGVGCQADSLFSEPTPITIPTRLILPTPTSTPQPILSSNQQSSQSAPHSQATAAVTATLPTTPQPSPTKKYVGKYSQRAKGIELNDDTENVDPGKLQADFGVIYGGAGGDIPFSNYEANSLALYQANIPCLLLWDILIPSEFDASNPAKSFPPEKEEPNVAAIVRATRGKPVAGIIIRFLNKKTPEGKTFTQGWMANYVDWIVKAVYHQTGKPVYVMSSQAFINGFGAAPDLNRVISNLDGTSSWKSAIPKQAPHLAAWNDFPVPADDYAPEYISGNSSLYFINYSRADWNFDGIDTTSTPLWLYYAPPDQLKKELGYQDHALMIPSTPTPAPGALLTQVVLPTQPSLVRTYVGKYSMLAKGIELNESTVKVDPTLLRADFGIVYGGAGEYEAKNYALYLKALDQANIPGLLLWDISIPADLNASDLAKTFPPASQDPNVANIARAARGKAVAGIIIRFLDKKTPNGKVFTQGWMANYIAWMVGAVYQKTGKPLYVMTSQDFINGFGKAPQLNEVVSSVDGMCSWKSAMPGQEPQLASWDDFPVPGDDYVPEYISNNPSLYFMNYARTGWKFDGIDAPSTPLWLYKGPPKQLKKDLGYQPHAAVTPPTPTPTATP